MFEDLLPEVLSVVRSKAHGGLGLVLDREAWRIMVWFPNKKSYYIDPTEFEVVRARRARLNEDMSAMIARLRETHLDPLRYRMVLVQNTSPRPWQQAPPQNPLECNLWLVPLWQNFSADLDRLADRTMYCHFYRGLVDASLYEPALAAWHNNELFKVALPEIPDTDEVLDALGESSSSDSSSDDGDDNDSSSDDGDDNDFRKCCPRA